MPTLPELRDNLRRRPLVAVVPGDRDGLARGELRAGKDVVDDRVVRPVVVVGRGPSLRTESGAVRASALKTGSKMWQPMSPNVPVPKSSRFRQLPG